MSFILYFLVLLVAASSVVFGLDWMQAPIPPVPMRQQAAVASAVPAPPKETLDPKAFDAKALDAKALDAKLSPVYPASPRAPAPPAADAAKPQPAANPARPARKCDVDACGRAYYSFRPYDCTFQPARGPRQICTKGHPPRPAPTTAAAQPAEEPARATDAQSTETLGAATQEPRPQGSEAQAQTPQSGAPSTCNVAACERAYISFTASDCSYQPSYGPRRICRK